ncbi:MAG: FixJ family two-component response regulator [Chlamydiales bacterium]|jgi:FixJ family two-component response regulator
MDFPIDELCARIRAVVVDDTQGDLDLTSHLLRSAASPVIDVVPFNDAAEAITELAQKDPDVILIDSHLGSCTGIEFLEHVRKAGVCAPAILLAGRGDGELSMAAWHAGFLDCLSKSILSERSLKRAIENVIEKHFLSVRAESYRQRLETTVRDLDARNREIAAFHATLEHELRTPLAVARELVSLMAEGLHGSVSNQQRDLLSSVLASCDQLGRCVNDLFDGEQASSYPTDAQPARRQLR